VAIPFVTDQGFGDCALGEGIDQEKYENHQLSASAPS
jgi:hypothetical protein